MSARASTGWEGAMRAIAGLSILLAATWIASCTDDVAGTNDETHTQAAARIMMPGGSTPAAGAKVTLVPTDGIVAVDSGQVDEEGHPVLPVVADGVYAMTASLGSLASWTDSVNVVAGRLAMTSDDTLAEAGTISGFVLLQPQHDSRTITVNVLGTDIWSNVDLDGRFSLPLLGAGVLRLRFSTTLADYTQLYQTVDLGVGQGFVFSDTLHLPYTGIPVVQGLRAVNDSATGDILLSWNAATHPHLVDYVVYRDTAGSVDYSTKPLAATSSTSWRDTTAKSMLREQTWRYRVAVRVSGNSTPGAWYEVVEATSTPPQLANLHAISWTSLGAPGGRLVGFLGSFFATANLEVGTDSVRLPTWSTVDGSSWTVGGTSFALRRMGQILVRAAGFGAGRVWCFGRSAIGDGIEVASSVDGRTWTVSTLADSLWPGDANLSVTGSLGRVALVAPGTRSIVLVGDSTGAWNRVTVTGRVLGVDDSGIWTDAGLARPTRVDAATGRNTLSDLDTWTATDSLKAIITWKGAILLHAGTRLWVRENASWSLRSTPAVNVLSADRDRLLVRDTLGTAWRGL